MSLFSANAALLKLYFWKLRTERAGGDAGQIRVASGQNKIEYTNDLKSILETKSGGSKLPFRIRIIVFEGLQFPVGTKKNCAKRLFSW